VEEVAVEVGEDREADRAVLRANNRQHSSSHNSKQITYPMARRRRRNKPSPLQQPPRLLIQMASLLPKLLSRSNRPNPRSNNNQRQCSQALPLSKSQCKTPQRHLQANRHSSNSRHHSNNPPRLPPRQSQPRHLLSLSQQRNRKQSLKLSNRKLPLKRRQSLRPRVKPSLQRKVKQNQRLKVRQNQPHKVKQNLLGKRPRLREQSPLAKGKSRLRLAEQLPNKAKRQRSQGNPLRRPVKPSPTLKVRQSRVSKASSSNNNRDSSNKEPPPKWYVSIIECYPDDVVLTWIFSLIPFSLHPPSFTIS